MKSNSTIYPLKYFKSNNKLFIVDLDSVVEITTNDLTAYSYNSYELQLSDRPKLDDYIEQNYQMLLDFAMEKDIEKMLIPSNEEILKAERELEYIDLLQQLEVL